MKQNGRGKKTETAIMRTKLVPQVLIMGILSLSGCNSEPDMPERTTSAVPYLRLSWEQKDNNGYIVIDGDHLPGKITVWYVELYMGPGSHTSFPKGVVKHTTTLVAADPKSQWLKLRCDLDDGVIVEHKINARRDVVEFEVTASNHTPKPSDVAWGAPCIIVDAFTSKDKFSYLSKCFVFLDGKLTRLPVEPWAVDAVETPGQVWCPVHVDRKDVEPHPLSELIPSNGLIGCFSEDEKLVVATAWQPYQNLFQGIITCLHSDFRINGLQPHETKRIHGKIYVTSAEIKALLRRYRSDFPEHLGVDSMRRSTLVRPSAHGG